MPFRAEICPFCKQAPKVKELPVVVVDADGDGMTDEWEKKYGLNPADAADAVLDKDGDGFTNLEEFRNATNPLVKDTPYAPGCVWSQPLPRCFSTRATSRLSEIDWKSPSCAKTL